MKVTSVKYERTYSFNFNNVKYGVDVQVEEGKTAEAVLMEARQIVKRIHKKMSAEDMAEAHLAKASREKREKAHSEAARSEATA